MPGPRTTRALRLLGWSLLGCAGLVLAAALLAPLVVRGERFGRMAARFIPPLAGQLRIGGGALGWDSAFALAFGRTVKVRLDDLEVRDPEGVEVLSAAELHASVQIESDPLRVTIHELRPQVARWRFARMRGRPGIGFLAAFRPPRPPTPVAVPPGPVAPITRPPAPRSPPGPARSGFAFSIVDAQLDGLSVTFDFPGWGLVLNDIKGAGHLTIRGRSGTRPPSLSFDVRRVDARRGGQLRILRGQARSEVPFDRVAIERVGSAGEGSGDLLLLVQEALTGRSRLSGRALFAGVLGRSPASGRAAPGMEIDADWQRAGDALTAVARARGLPDLRASGDAAQVRVKVKSSFRDIDGSFLLHGLDLEHRGQRLQDLGVEILVTGPPYAAVLRQVRFRSPRGGHAEATGALGPYGRTRLRLRLANVDIEEWLPRYLRPLLGGVASGYLATRGDMRTDRIVLEGMDLLLERNRRGPLPRRVRLSTGAAPLPAGPAGPAEESLIASLRGVRWDRGRLSVSGLLAQGFGGRLVADATLAMRDAERRPLPVPRLDVALAVQRFALERALPGSGLRGDLSFALDARGPLNDLNGRLGFPEGATLSLFDQTYQLPRGAALLIRGDELTLPRIGLGAPGGGSIVVGGRLQPGLVDLQVAIAGHRLERVPFLARALPSLAGRLDGRLRLRGDPRRPGLQGDVRLGAVSLRGVALGDGTISLRPVAGGESQIAGELFRHLSLKGRIGLGIPSPRLSLEVTARELRLDPFLPPAPLLEGGRLLVTGRFLLAARPPEPLLVTADLATIALELGCNRPTPPGGCLRLANVGPVRLRSLGGPRHLELFRSRLQSLHGPRGAGLATASEADSDVVVAGVLADGTLAASLEGRLGAGLAGPLLRRWPVTVSGAIDAAVQARGPLRAPAVTGTLKVRRPVSVRVRPLPWDVRLVSGALAFDQTGVSSEGLGFEAPGARLRLAGTAPFGTRDDARRPLRVSLSGVVAGAFLARLFPTVIAAADGNLGVDGSLDGTLQAPRFSGQATLSPMSLRLRYRDTRVAVRSGRLRASGQTLLLEQLVADLSPGGRLQVGPAGQPAQIEVLSLYPLAFGQVRLPAIGQRLMLELPWLSVRDGSFDVVLTGHASHGPLHLRGAVNTGVARYAPARQPRKGQGAGGRLARRLPPTVRSGALPLNLDLDLRGERLVVDPGWMPDVHLGVHVRLAGTTDRPAVNWQASGKGLYSVIALFLYRLFS